MAPSMSAVKWIYISGYAFCIDGAHEHTRMPQNTNGIFFLLSHAHSDHTRGIDDRYGGPPIWMSERTAKILSIIRPSGITVLEKLLRPFPDPPRLGSSLLMTLDGVDVDVIDANHCPGAVMFLFTAKSPLGANSRVLLHTGDARLDSRVASLVMNTIARKGGGPRLDSLYLDTTYAMPSSSFPGQEEVLERLISFGEEQASQRWRPAGALSGWVTVSPSSSSGKREGEKKEEEEKGTLFVVGGYSIGKEKVAAAVAQGAACGVWVYGEKGKLVIAGEAIPSHLLIIDKEPLQERRRERRRRASLAGDVEGGGGDGGGVGDGGGEASTSSSTTTKPLSTSPSAVILTSLSHVSPTKLYDILVAANGGTLTSYLTSTSSSVSSSTTSKPLPSSSTAFPLFDRVVGVRPTGWVWKSGSSEGGGEAGDGRKVDLISTKVSQRGRVLYATTSYSEHSSFPELCAFLEATKPRSITPTVISSSSTDTLAPLAPYCPPDCINGLTNTRIRKRSHSASATDEMSGE